MHDLPDDELPAVIAKLEGTSPEVLAQPELVRLLLPLFRANLEVWETYVPHRGPLHVPVTALGGRHDPSVGLDMLSAWRSLTSAEFQLSVFDGGHFCHHAVPGAVTSVLRNRLRESVPAPEIAWELDHDTAVSPSVLCRRSVGVLSVGGVTLGA